MKRLILALLLAAPIAHAKPPLKNFTVVETAPDFTFAAPGKARSLRSLRGQAVVLVVTQGPGVSAFKKQLKELAPLYQELASKNVVFVAAFKTGEGPVPSNIPFVLADDGAGVAAKYNVTDKFGIAIIGRDGNLDCQTEKVLPGGRVRDVVQNSYVVQSEIRKR